MVATKVEKGGIEEIIFIICNRLFLEGMDYYKLKVLNNKKKIIFSVSLIIITLLLGGYYFFYYQRKDKKEDNNNEIVLVENNVNENVNNNIYVDIKGYVEKPGVYSFLTEDNARINDLILKAGGLKKEADTSLINLSRKLEDEMTVIIYSKKEVEDYLNGKNELKEKLAICEDKLKNNACINNEYNNKSQININQGTKEELMTLPGIGEAKANAIIEYRNKTPFKSIEDLLNVDGIGDSLFESIKESITV